MLTDGASASPLLTLCRSPSVGDTASIAVEEFVEGHEGFYDTITVDGGIAHDWATHYYPNVLEAMRHRWISPQFITTNRNGVHDDRRGQRLGSRRP